MEYRDLGRSSVKVSALCLGCMNFGWRTDEAESVRIIHAAIDAGINFIDTANIYGRGASEEITGKALAMDGRRDRVVLATKVGGVMGDGPNERGVSRYHIMRQAEGSLKRLRTDRIDLYQIHFMYPQAPLAELLRALDDLVRQGKVLYTGVSKWAPALLTEAIMLSDRYGWAKFLTEQPPYNLLDRRIENEVIWNCRRHGMGIIPWAPIGAGILSGKYGKTASPPEGSRFRQFGTRLTPAAIDVADALKPLADQKGVTPAEMSLAWVLRQPGITAPIIGPRTLDHLNSSLRALDVTFTVEDYRRIDEISPPGSAVSDYYDVNVYAKLRETLRPPAVGGNA